MTAAAIELARPLFDPARAPADAPLVDGHLDMLGETDPTGPHPGQRWMTSSALPQIYERVWRPSGDGC